MLRFVCSIMVLMLCSFALADNHYVAKNTIPASVSSLVEVDSGFPESPELVFTLTKSISSVGPLYFLNGLALAQPCSCVAQRIYGNTSIRSPPIAL